MMIPSWRYKKFHASVLLAWLGVGLLAGVFLGQFLTSFSHPVMWVVTALLLGIAFHSRRWFACLVIVLVGVYLGGVRGAGFMHELQQTDSYVGRNLTVRGVISQDAVLKNGSDLWQVQLTNIKLKDKLLAGEIYATVTSDNVLKRGDTITIEGKAKQGFGSFRLNFLRASVAHIERPDDPFLVARDTFADGVRKVVPEPEASLGLGFLVGQKSNLPGDLAEQMKTVGLTHIIVASGYNLTILVRFARRGLAKRSRYLALMGSLMFVAGFVLVSGFSPSMNRAAIVTFLTLAAWYYGRKFHPIKLILYVASLSALAYPSYLWTDLGWLLSFTAFTGVLVVAPLATKLLFGKKKEPGALSRLVIETLSAEVMTLPIIIAVFGYVPALALVANIAVAPVIPFAMLFTFIAGVVGLLAPFLIVLAMPASIVIAFVVAVVEWLSGPEWARLVFQLPIPFVVGWYGLILVLGVMILKRRRVDLLDGSVVE